MYKNDMPPRYGIKKHIKGSFYDEDCLVIDEHYHVLSYIYKESANYMCEQLNKAHSGRIKFYVVRMN